jgi:glycosyltransferase involved in cell wall biosynthesis
MFPPVRRKEERMRFALVSAHLNTHIGYSRVGYHILDELKKAGGVELFHFAHHAPAEGAPLLRGPIEGVVTEEHADFAFETLQAFLDKHAIDVCLVYNDIGVILTYLHHVKHPRVWAYADVVGQLVPSGYIQELHAKTERVYWMTDFWKKLYGDADSKVMEHGVDSSVFHPLPAARVTELRANMGIPAQATVFLNVNRNTKRKRLDTTVSAFVQFCRREPILAKTSYLVILTNKEGFYNLPLIIHTETQQWKTFVAKRILLIDSGAHPFTDEQLNGLYNVATVGVNTSTGEGYGLPSMEMMACKKAQVMTELPHYPGLEGATFVQQDEVEYSDGHDYMAGLIPVFRSSEVAHAMTRSVSLKRFAFKAKTWKEACAVLVKDLTDGSSHD